MARESAPGPPLCLRFKPDDLELVKKVAREKHLPCSTWIRSVALERSQIVLAGIPFASLVVETAGGEGSQICVRLNAKELEQLKKAANQEGIILSSWIRATVMQFIQLRKR